MNISIALDYFDTKQYNEKKWLHTMKAFMEYNFNIDKIVLACYVPPKGGGTPIHKSRPSHGLAFHTGGSRYYTFNEHNFLVKNGDMIYLPKNSNYTVDLASYGGCYAIKFDISETTSFPPFVFRVKTTTTFLTVSNKQRWYGELRHQALN